MDSFDYINAPTFCDFNELEENEVCNNYFEQNYELPNDPLTTLDPLNTSDIHAEVTIIIDELDNMKLSNPNKLRKSMSVGDLHDVVSNMHRLRSGKEYQDNEKTKDDTSADVSSSSKVTASDVPFLQKRSSSMKDRINQLNRSRLSKATIPQSPKLMTKLRKRSVHALSYEQQQQLDLDEAKKSQFKANPLNKKIFEPPAHNVQAKKPTVPEPFKMAAPVKKVSQSPAKTTFEFHANPVPKSVYVPKLPVIKPALRTHITKPGVKVSQDKNETVVSQPKLKPTKPQPFSFEMRDLHLKSKREELIKKVCEAEKKAREFHAKPPPKSVLNSSTKLHSAHGSQRSLHSGGKTKSEDNLTTTFKAKPPTVLYKPPFIPKMAEKPLTEINDIILNTDVRNKQREEFEQHLKEREELVAQLKQKEMLIKLQQETEEIKKARKMGEFRAHEIKKYKEVKIQPSQKVTIPVSPSFSVRHRNNKENTA